MGNVFMTILLLKNRHHNLWTPGICIHEGVHRGQDQLIHIRIHNALILDVCE